VPMNVSDSCSSHRFGGWQWLVFGVFTGLVLALPCCDAFNPAFVDVLGPGVVSPRGPDSSGHVVVAFRNDTIFDERVLQGLVDAGLDRALLDVPDLRPRVRMLLQITFLNGESLQVEFNDGSSTIIHPAINAAEFPDLTRTQQNNLVVQCDVVRVELLSLPSIFVPDFFEFTRIDPGDANTRPFRVRTRIDPPQFKVLQRDSVDQFGNTLEVRNIGVRDAPAPAIAPNCGSVVTITMSGTLTLPTERNAFGEDTVGVLVTDTARIAASPGQFRINVGIR